MKLSSIQCSTCKVMVLKDQGLNTFTEVELHFFFHNNAVDR